MSTIMFFLGAGFDLTALTLRAEQACVCRLARGGVWGVLPRVFGPSPWGAVGGGLKARHQGWAKRSKNLIKRSM